MAGIERLPGRDGIRGGLIRSTRLAGNRYWLRRFRRLIASTLQTVVVITTIWYRMVGTIQLLPIVHSNRFYAWLCWFVTSTTLNPCLVVIARLFVCETPCFTIPGVFFSCMLVSIRMIMIIILKWRKNQLTLAH